MIKTNAILKKEYVISKEFDFISKNKQIESIAKKYIGNYNLEIIIITEEEIIEIKSYNEFLDKKQFLKEEILQINFIYKGLNDINILLIADYKKDKIKFTIMLENKEINKIVEEEIKQILDISEVYIENKLKIKKGQMIINPIFKEQVFIVNKNSCFIVMPFCEKWSNRVYSRIKSILDDKKIDNKRADDLYGENVLDDIWKAINESHFIIADTTGKNPNVFYEIGIAHTLGKKVILLTQNINDIPFDFKLYRHIEYEDNTEGFDKLERELEKNISALNNLNKEI